MNMFNIIVIAALLCVVFALLYICADQFGRIKECEEKRFSIERELAEERNRHRVLKARAAQFPEGFK